MEIAKGQTAEPVVKLDISEERLPAPLQHPSGKRRLMPLLLHLMPEHEIYCEPFCGMACVFFGKPPSGKEILNDLDSDYAIVLKFLRDATESDWDHLKAKNWRPSRNQFEEFAKSKPANDLDKVHRAIYLMRLGYRGLKGKGNYSPAAAQRLGSGIPPLLYARRHEYKARLQGVIISSQDFQKSMQSHDSANTLFYLDPPYVSGPGSGPQHYLGANEEESKAIFQRLLKTLQGIKGKWIMTHSQNPKISDALERIGNLRNVRVTEPTDFEGEGASRIEMIAANFKLPHRLQIRYIRKGIPIMSLEMSQDVDESQPMQKIPVRDINPTTLRREDAKQVLNLHLRMHQLWGTLAQRDSLDGTTREDIVNAHYFVAQELARRDFRHFMHDSLDDTLQEAPLGKTMQKIYVERAKPAWRIFELDDLQEIDAFKPENAELVLEVKWDGERIQSQKHNGRVEIWSDYPRRVDHRLPHQVKELEAMKLDNFRLDSEAVMLEPESKETLHRTMVTALLNGKFDPTERAKILHLIVFDCLEFDGKDLRDQPLTERIKFLKEFTGTDHIHLLTDYLSEDPGKDALAYLIPRSHKRFEAAIDKLMEK